MISSIYILPLSLAVLWHTLVLRISYVLGFKEEISVEDKLMKSVQLKM